MQEEKSNKEIVFGKEKTIRLVGFDNLDPAELSIIKKIIGHYLKKIDNLTEYEEVRVNLKLHKKQNYYLHEIKTEIFKGSKIFVAESDNKNIYVCLTGCFEALISEIKKEKQQK